MSKKERKEYIRRRNSVLESQLQNLLNEIEEQAAAVIRYTNNTFGIDVKEIRNSDGSWVMVDILSAKAKILHALVQLRSVDA